jgi:hypothetical protein
MGVFVLASQMRPFMAGYCLWQDSVELKGVLCLVLRENDLSPTF